MTTDITHRFSCPEHGMFTMITPHSQICPVLGICHFCKMKHISSSIDDTAVFTPHIGIKCNGHCEVIEHRINARFHFKDGHLVKTTNGQPIPIEEPVFIFRARDHLTLAVLEYYRQEAIKDGCNEWFLREIDECIQEFRQYRIQFYDRMKQPGVTRGR